nr:MAG TPA: hypothetical protein [Caudoviricetes sp.]
MSIKIHFFFSFRSSRTFAFFCILYTFTKVGISAMPVNLRYLTIWEYSI